MEKPHNQIYQDLLSADEWYDDEVRLLISIWEEYSDLLRKPGRNAQIYQVMTHKLQDLTDRPVARTRKEIMRKIDSLKKQYYSNLRRFKKMPVRWRFFHQIHKFFGTSAKTSDEVPQPVILYEGVCVEEWGDYEIKLLITIWEEYIDELRKTGRTGHIYQLMADKLQTLSGRSVPRTRKQVMRKIDNLKKQYYGNLRKYIDSSVPWRFFNDIHRFFGISKEKSKKRSSPMRDCEQDQKLFESDTNEDAEQEENQSTFTLKPIVNIIMDGNQIIEECIPLPNTESQAGVSSNPKRRKIQRSEKSSKIDEDHYKYLKKYLELRYQELGLKKRAFELEIQKRKIDSKIEQRKKEVLFERERRRDKEFKLKFMKNSPFRKVTDDKSQDQLNDNGQIGKADMVSSEEEEMHDSTHTTDDELSEDESSEEESYASVFKKRRSFNYLSIFKEDPLDCVMERMFLDALLTRL